MSSPIQVTTSLLRYALSVADRLNALDAEIDKTEMLAADWYAHVAIEYDGMPTGVGVVLSGDYDRYVVTLDPEALG